MRVDDYLKVYRKLAGEISNIVKRSKLYEFHASIEEFVPALAGIVNRYNRYPGIQGQLDYTLDEMQVMAEAFYEDFNPRLYKRLKGSLEKIEIHASEPCVENKGKENCMRKSDGRVEMFLNPTSNVEGACCVAHEYSHACSQRMVEDTREVSELIGEIESKFIEKVYLDWLLSNEAISQEDYDFKTRAQRQDLVVDCDSVLAEMDLLKLINHDFDYKHIQEVLWQRPTLEKCINNMQQGKVSPWLARYIVGEIVAQALYREYCINPQEVSERFTNYMQHNAEMTMEEAVKFLLGENYVEKINAEFFPKKQDEQS